MKCITILLYRFFTVSPFGSETAGRLTRPVGLPVSLTQPVHLPVSLTRPVGLPLSPNLIDLAHRKQVVRLSTAEPSRQCKRESEVPR